MCLDLLEERRGRGAVCENSTMGEGGRAEEMERQRATKVEGRGGGLGWGGVEGLVPIWLNHKEYRGQLFVEEIKLGSQAIL